MKKFLFFFHKKFSLKFFPSIKMGLTPEQIADSHQSPAQNSIENKFPSSSLATLLPYFNTISQLEEIFLLHDSINNLYFTNSYNFHYLNNNLVKYSTPYKYTIFFSNILKNSLFYMKNNEIFNKVKFQVKGNMIFVGAVYTRDFSYRDETIITLRLIYHLSKHSKDIPDFNYYKIYDIRLILRFNPDEKNQEDLDSRVAQVLNELKLWPVGTSLKALLKFHNFYCTYIMKDELYSQLKIENFEILKKRENMKIMKFYRSEISEEKEQHILQGCAEISVVENVKGEKKYLYFNEEINSDLYVAAMIMNLLPKEGKVFDQVAQLMGLFDQKVKKDVEKVEDSDIPQFPPTQEDLEDPVENVEIPEDFLIAQFSVIPENTDEKNSERSDEKTEKDQSSSNQFSANQLSAVPYPTLQNAPVSIPENSRESITQQHSIKVTSSEFDISNLTITEQVTLMAKLALSLYRKLHEVSDKID